MRVALQNLYVNNISSLQKSTADVAVLNQKMAQSERILRPSDDPIGTVRIKGSERNLAQVEQYVKNIDDVSTGLSRAETYLTAITDIQQRMRTIAVTTNNDAISPEDRQGYAEELSQLIESVLDNVNAKDSAGNSLFAGNKIDVTPVELNPVTGRYEYKGDAGERDVQVSATSWRTINTSADKFLFSTAGDDLLNAAAAYVEVLKNPALRPADAAFQTGLTNFQTSMKESLDTIGNAITTFGGTQNSLSLLKGSHQQIILFNNQVIGEAKGLDYAKASADFNVKLVALKATQKTFAQVTQLSLFNVM